MAKANPTRPDPPASATRLRDPTALPDDGDPPGVDAPTDLLDVVLEQMADDGDHRNFADDVRSDSTDDEKRERR